MNRGNNENRVPMVESRLHVDLPQDVDMHGLSHQGHNLTICPRYASGNTVTCTSIPSVSYICQLWMEQRVWHCRLAEVCKNWFVDSAVEYTLILVQVLVAGSKNILFHGS
jgi:hypothetical protein